MPSELDSRQGEYAEVRLLWEQLGGEDILSIEVTSKEESFVLWTTNPDVAQDMFDHPFAWRYEDASGNH